MIIFQDKIFKKPFEIISAFNSEEIDKAFYKINLLKKGFYLVGYLSYQTKEFFLKRKIKSKTPLIYFEAHKQYEKKYPKTFKKANLYIKKISLLINIDKIFKK